MSEEHPNHDTREIATPDAAAVEPGAAPMMLHIVPPHGT